MFALIIYTLSVFALWFAFAYNPKSECLKHSELSNPSIHKPPVWFHKGHYEVLETLYEWIELMDKQIKIQLWKKWHDTNAKQLSEWGYITRRWVEYINPQWKPDTYYLYKITSKGKDALSNFSHKF